MNDIKESKFRLIVAWVSWWLMLSGCAILALGVLNIIILYNVGGTKLLHEVWNGTEDRTQDYTSFLYPLIFISVPLGGKIGIWLWAKFARKIKLVCDAKISKMGG